MRATLVVLTLVATLSVGATAAYAQVVTEEPRQATQQQSKSDVQEEFLVVRIQDLTLTEEQEARINDIRKEYRPKVEQAAKELKTLVSEQVDKIRNALTAEQREKIRGMLEEREQFREETLAHVLTNLKELDLTEDELAKIRQIRGEFRPKMQAEIKDLQGLFTEAQKQARKQAVDAGKTRKEILTALNLTSDQTAQLESVGKQLKELVGDEAVKIRVVLNATQEQQLQDLKAERKEMVRDRLAHRIENLQALNLTDQQKTTLTSIRQEYRPKIQEAGNRLRAMIGEEVKKIVGILNPDKTLASDRPLRTR